MPHLNTFLLHSARRFLSNHVQGPQYRYKYDPETLVPDVERTDESCEPSDYPFIRDYLPRAAGQEHGIRSVREVLKDELVKVAKEHTRNATTAVGAFCVDLERRSLARFLEEGEENDLIRREAKLRRKLGRLGYRLTKSRRRNPLDPHYMVYDIIHRITREINLDAPRHLAGLETWVETMTASECERLSPRIEAPQPSAGYLATTYG